MPLTRSKLSQFARGQSSWLRCPDLCDLWSFIEFLAINWAIAWLVIAEEGVTVSNLRAILDTDCMGLVSCVVAFWFGNRTFGKWKT